MPLGFIGHRAGFVLVLAIYTPMAYIFVMWAPTDVAFEIVAEDTDHPVATIEIATPAGLILLMAEVSDEGRTLRLMGAHVQSDIGPNEIGFQNLKLLADVAMERMDYDEIIVEGAVRTTGTRPGRRPSAIRFRRRSGSAADNGIG